MICLALGHEDPIHHCESDDSAHGTDGCEEDCESLRKRKYECYGDYYANSSTQVVRDRYVRMNRIVRHRSFEGPQKPCHRGENIDNCDIVEFQLASSHLRGVLPIFFAQKSCGRGFESPEAYAVMSLCRCLDRLGQFWLQKFSRFSLECLQFLELLVVHGNVARNFDRILPGKEI